MNRIWRKKNEKKKRMQRFWLFENEIEKKQEIYFTMKSDRPRIFVVHDYDAIESDDYRPRNVTTWTADALKNRRCHTTKWPYSRFSDQRSQCLSNAIFNSFSEPDEQLCVFCNPDNRHVSVYFYSKDHVSNVLTLWGSTPRLSYACHDRAN